MPDTDITERRDWDAKVPGQEVRIRLGLNDRIEITDETANYTITIQDDGRGRAEIAIVEGKVTLYM